MYFYEIGGSLRYTVISVNVYGIKEQTFFSVGDNISYSSIINDKLYTSKKLTHAILEIIRIFQFHFLQPCFHYTAPTTSSATILIIHNSPQLLQF